MSSRHGTIEVIARGIAKDRAGRVLLCKNLKHGYYYLPGGHVEPSEPVAAALKREFMEEAGVEIRVKRLIACEEHLFTQKNRSRHELNLVFHVELRDMKAPVRSLEGHIGFEWLSASALRGIDLRPRSAARMCTLKTGPHGARWIAANSTE